MHKEIKSGLLKMNLCHVKQDINNRIFSFYAIKHYGINQGINTHSINSLVRM